MSERIWLFRRAGVGALSVLKAETMIGRAKGCDVLVDDASVSRWHARITSSSLRTMVQDRASRNGTFVNERRIREALLGRGDALRLGRAVFEVLDDDGMARVLRHDETVSTDDTAQQPAGNGPSAVMPALTDAEKIVLHLLLKGYSEKEVANELDVSCNTVHEHVKHLHVKFAVDSRARLLAVHIPGV